MISGPSYLSPRAARISPALSAILLFGSSVVLFSLLMLGLPENSKEYDSPSREEPASLADASPDGDITPAEALESTEEGSIERILALEGRKGSARLKKFEPLRGWVLGDDGTPVAGAAVTAVHVRNLDRVLRPEEFATFKTNSGKDGRFVFSRVPVGHYSICANKGGLAGRVEAFAAGPESHPKGVVKDYEILLKPSGSIAGLVIGPDQNPVPKAWVMSARMRAASARTDARGRFILRHLKRGLHDIQVKAKGMAPKRVKEVTTGKEDLEIVLSPGGSIRGKVLQDGEPLGGIAVMASHYSSRSPYPVESVSGSDGSYALENLADGRYYVAAVGEKFSSSQTRVEIDGEEEKDDIDLELKPHGSLAGRVMDAETGEPLKDVWVRVILQGRGHPHAKIFDRHNVFSDDEGGFRFPSLCAGEYILGAVGREGYASDLWLKGQKIEIMEDGAREDIELKLKRGGSVRVHVRGESGEPVLRAKFRLSKADQEEHYNLEYYYRDLFPEPVEAGEGLYRYQGLPAGVFDVNVSKTGWIPKKESVAVEPEGGEAELEVVLAPSFAAAGKVLDEDEKGISGACVNFGDERCDMTGPDGSFRVEDISPGRNYMTVLAEGYVRFYERKTIDEAVDDLEVTLLNEGSHFLAGRAKSAEGRPMPDVHIRVSQKRDSSSLTKETDTEEDGTFRVDGLLEGTANVYASSSHGSPLERSKTVDVDRSDVVIVIQRYGKVKGKVIDAVGEPVEAFTAYASVRSEVGNNYMGTSSKDFTDGEFEFDKVSPGRVTVHAWTKDGRSAYSDGFSIGPGDVYDNLVLTLTKTGSLSGVVVDRDTLQPVAGASVYAEPWLDTSRSYLRWMEPKSITAEDGTFTCENLRPGTMHVMVKHPDFCLGTKKDLKVNADQVTGGVLILLARGGVIQGYVYEKGVGKTGVKLSARGKGENESETTSGKDGHYQIRNLPADSYQVRAYIYGDNKEWYALGRKIELGPGDVIDWDLNFDGTGSIEGIVYLYGEPKENVSVSLRPKSDKELRESGLGSCTGGGRSRKDGSYRIEGLFPGVYDLSANLYSREQGSIYKRYTVEVGTGVTTYNVHVGEGGLCQVSGYVLRDGLPLSGVRLSASGGGVSKRLYTKKDGYYCFTLLPAGRVSLRAYMKDKSRRSSISRSLELFAGDALQHDFNFVTGTGILAGRVMGNEQPVKSGRVNVTGKISESGESLSTSASVADGEYRLEGLPPGKYTAMLYRPRFMQRKVEVKRTGESRADFYYLEGSAEIEGSLILTGGGNKKAPRFSIYLFHAGTCPWKEGGTFDASASMKGKVAETSSRNNKFSLRKLPVGVFDVVAVRVKDGKIAELQIQRVSLTDGEKTPVELYAAG